MRPQNINTQLSVMHLDMTQTREDIIPITWRHLSMPFRRPANAPWRLWHGLWRIILAIALILTAASPASAQEGLNINKVFQRFGHAKGCRMVEIHNTKMKGFELKIYKSLTYKNLGPKIGPYLKADRKNARKIREVVENGQIVSGYYMMPPKGKGINRYILFSKVQHNRGTVIYIEGDLSPDDIMKLCYA